MCLENENLYADLLQPPLDRAGCIANLLSNEGSRQPIICPNVLRAALSGCVNRVIELLRLTEDRITYINDASGRRGYGDCLCLLGEVTAKNNTVLRMVAERGRAELKKIIPKDKCTEQNYTVLVIKSN